MEERIPLVVDNGSSTCKAGLAGESTPSVIFSSVVGRIRHTGITIGAEHSETYIGDAAQAKRGLLALEYPIERGIVKDWNAMEKIWHHMFYNELKASPEEQPVLVTEAPQCPKANRETIVQTMFETFNVPASFVFLSGRLCEATFGLCNCLVVDSGDGVTQVVPNYEGHCIIPSIVRLDLAGKDITHYLAKLLNQNGYSFATSSEMELVREIKEKLCFVSLGLDNHVERTYETPDGRVIKIENEIFQCVEALFKPSLLGMQSMGIHEAIYSSVMKCPVDIRKDLCGTILLSGGTTLFPGFVDRLKKELDDLFSMKVRVIGIPDRKYMVWAGGSQVASLNSFYNFWITKEEYWESGPCVVHKKCF
eukprot:TRINITY_DN161_c0_g2_i1.p1 TRINITY_DN161_c0_g2~~TRINITY_DN161_c0_g2_i1.p1  ORF type:complete len:364 (-),score=54.99 TRINITY_DN161_c0_g2_i1:16-1107(-)